MSFLKKIQLPVSWFEPPEKWDIQKSAGDLALSPTERFFQDQLHEADARAKWAVQTARFAANGVVWIAVYVALKDIVAVAEWVHRVLTKISTL